MTIGYRKGRREVVMASGLSATLERGKLTCLLGRNGTGKSTLLRTLAGLQPPLNPQLSTVNCQLSTLNCQLSTFRRPRPHPAPRPAQPHRRGSRWARSHAPHQFLGHPPR
ncbi:MAG: ATP-binding cassette domain-containing protein [Prevotella sp.]|nr:ATP-binding cassette domain-containing protein [Prevotella sp.]